MHINRLEYFEITCTLRDRKMYNDTHSQYTLKNVYKYLLVYSYIHIIYIKYI